MQTYIGLAAMVLAVGCNLDDVNDLETSETAAPLSRQCPDPEEKCPVGNGGGVYTEELGNAHIGNSDLMLTRFMNVNGHVYVAGRGLDSTGTSYAQFTGDVVDASYNGTYGYTVVSVSESLTVPKFMLRAGSAAPFPVDGDDILNLRLVIEFDGVDYTLSFWNPQGDTGTSGYNTATLRMYYMRWNPGKVFNGATSQPYCTRAPINGSVPDPVVFQQGIGVNALSAKMVRNDSYVTLSCRYGAIATVRWWGYVYRGNAAQSTMFEAAMHMKRASYCGDDTFFTRANTYIYIKDIVPNQHGTVTPTNMEASWGADTNGRIRALCVTDANRRRPLAKYYGDVFDRTCNGTVSPAIPDCPLGYGDGLGPLADQSP